MSYQLYSEHKEAITTNNLDYFKTNNVSKEQLSYSLDFSIRANKISFIKYFVENNVSISNVECISALASKSNSLKTLKYLHSNNIKVDVKGNFPLYYAGINNKYDNFLFLEQFSEKDSIVFSHILRGILFRDKDKSLKNPLQNFKEILKIVLHKIKEEDFFKILVQKDIYNPSTKDIVSYNQKYLEQLYLDKELSIKEKEKTKKLKL